MGEKACCKKWVITTPGVVGKATRGMGKWRVMEDGRKRVLSLQRQIPAREFAKIGAIC
jgi:hypothetical protein